MPETSPPRGYVVCATQRSGSTYLAQLLASTGRLGRPTDFFNAAGRRAKGWHDYPDDPQRQLELVLAHGATDNAVYGLKAFPEYLDALDAAGWTDRLPGLHWIYLRRDDLLGQAISLVIASQTGRWRSTAAPLAAPRYDAAAIRTALVALRRADARWRAVFARHHVRPLELRYECVAADPPQAVRRVAALLGVDGAVDIDPAHVDVGVQRDAVNVEWRARFAVEAQRLTVSVITRNSEAHLPRLLAEAASYADEIVVGVDSTSDDRTIEAARAGADVVYRFKLPRQGQLAPARMLPFDYATGDWILSLDDDESMEPAFGALAPELMRAPNVTHYYFPRKWVVNDDPWEYAHAAPWFPNWSPRMFRNDRSLVWKPARAHSMYHLQGPGFYESRAAIVHFEPLWCGSAKRAAKIAAYRAAGASGLSEDYYAIPAGVARRALSPRAPYATDQRRPQGVLHAEVRELVTADHPPWCSTIEEVQMPQLIAPGQPFIAEVTARNTGLLAWSPTYAQWPANDWPLIRLGFHLMRAAGGEPRADAHRTELPRFVAPGDAVTFIAEVTAPPVPGAYELEWDLLSENDCWFASCGSIVARTPLSVAGGVP